ncbi:MAG: sulfite exporter TauE/SafE family protein, partial [Bacteroidia bacterium]|nr:sulfite exporter TauE/SafE family protein [Bacteroidia bacterium]
TLTAFNMEKDAFIATSALIDFAIDLSRSGVYVYNGYVHKHDLYLIPFLLGVGFLGTYIGKKILNFIPQQTFKTIVLFLILLTGCASLIKVI